MRFRSVLFVLLLLTRYGMAGAPVALADSSVEQTYPISATWPHGVQAYLRVETSPTVFNVLYRWGQTVPASNGAYGPNVTAPRSAWYIEYQRAGNTDIIGGVLHGNTAMVGEGLKMFHFGLAREASNGALPGSIWPFHGTAMFLAESAPALIVLEHSPVARSFARELRWESARMRLAARHLIGVVHGVGKIDDHTKNHRFYEAALALGSVGVLAEDPTLRRWSTRYAWKAIHMERPDGVMPEDGGHDSGYQALGMTYAARYLELVAAGPLRVALDAALRRGERWELSRLHVDGTVNQQGDTRTAGCRERNPKGQCKTTFYATISNALARWSVIAHLPRFQRAAYAVWLQNWKLVPGDVLPPPGLRVQPSDARLGSWLTVSGAGFQPLETVRIYFGSTFVQSIHCDQTGTFGGHSSQPNAHFSLPKVAPGTYTITAHGSMGTVRRVRVPVST